MLYLKNEFKNLSPDETRTSQRLAHQTLAERAILQSESRCFGCAKIASSVDSFMFSVQWLCK